MAIQFKSSSRQHRQRPRHLLILPIRIISGNRVKANPEISPIRGGEPTVETKNLRIPGVDPQKSAIIAIKPATSKRTVGKKTPPKGHKGPPASQIQIQTPNQILSRIQLPTAIKVDNPGTQPRFGRWEPV